MFQQRAEATELRLVLTAAVGRTVLILLVRQAARQEDQQRLQQAFEQQMTVQRAAAIFATKAGDRVPQFDGVVAIVEPVAARPDERCRATFGCQFVQEGVSNRQDYTLGIAIESKSVYVVLRDDQERAAR